MSARISQGLKAQLLVVVLRRHLNKAQRKRFWRGMRVALRRHSLVFAQVGGVCAVLSVGHPLGETDCRWVVDWLIDQPQVRQVVVLPRKTLAQFRSNELEVGFEEREASPDECEGIRRAIRVLLEMALRHYAVALRQADASLLAVGHG